MPEGDWSQEPRAGEAQYSAERARVSHVYPMLRATKTGAQSIDNYMTLSPRDARRTYLRLMRRNFIYSAQSRCRNWPCEY